MKILVTGGCGYIGAHVVRRLAQRGFAVVATDMPNAQGNDISEFADSFFAWDITQPLPASSALVGDGVDVVVHLAARVAVEESVCRPALYYNTNLFGTMNIIRHFPKCKMIFASTGAAFEPLSPYAKSKVAAEDVIKECCAQHTIFRFYNVAGSGGFKSFNEPTHLMRRAAMAARGDISHMAIFGTDYETKDGTCIRDYVHVEDIADAIAEAATSPAAMTAYECLGSGQGHSVREVITTMQKVSGKDFKIVEEARRAGDSAISAVPTLSTFITPQRTLEDMCRETLAHL